MKHPEARTPVATRPRTDIWPSERTARLIELWPSDLSASAIAIELGVTKNAVIGKADRLIDDRILFPKPTYSYLRALSGEQREQLMAELNAGLEERPLGR